PEKETRLRAVGAEIILLPNAAGKVDLPALMRELGRREINELHVEAGAKLNASLVRAGCVDELLVYLAPALIGAGLPMFDLPALDCLDQKHVLKFHQVKQIGDDLRILARFKSL
ncbi:MAG: diaminohydroxyphosphoribosylaminopyrimidine deaminase, partial [Janthinobacterium sp.]